jgi:hypothetical protein
MEGNAAWGYVVQYITVFHETLSTVLSPGAAADVSKVMTQPDAPPPMAK